MAAKKRKTPYVPGIAAMNFKPDFDWSKEDAMKLFSTKKSDLLLDKIEYTDCIAGMKNLPAKSVDLVIADPPFGIEFSKKEHLYNRKSEFVPHGYEEISKMLGTSVGGLKANYFQAVKKLAVYLKEETIET
jgi:DNA modification methylase